MNNFGWKIAVKIFSSVFSLSVALGSMAFLFSPESLAIAIPFWIMNFPAGVALWLIAWATDFFPGPGGDDKADWVMWTMLVLVSLFSAVFWAALVGFLRRRRAEPIQSATANALDLT